MTHYSLVAGDRLGTSDQSKGHLLSVVPFVYSPVEKEIGTTEAVTAVC